MLDDILFKGLIWVFSLSHLLSVCEKLVCILRKCSFSFFDNFCLVLPIIGRGMSFTIRTVVFITEYSINMFECLKKRHLRSAFSNDSRFSLITALIVLPTKLLQRLDMITKEFIDEKENLIRRSLSGRNACCGS